MPCTITGKKPSGLPDPIVPIGLDDSWLIIETSDGRVCKIRPSVLAGISSEIFEFVQAGFSGTTISVPALINGGKFPLQDSKIQVYTNGSLDYPVEVIDYNIIHNGVGVADQIVFTQARDGDDILVRFNL